MARTRTILVVQHHADGTVSAPRTELHGRRWMLICHQTRSAWGPWVCSCAGIELSRGEVERASGALPVSVFSTWRAGAAARANWVSTSNEGLWFEIFVYFDFGLGGEKELGLGFVFDVGARAAAPRARSRHEARARAAPPIAPTPRATGCARAGVGGREGEGAERWIVKTLAATEGWHGNLSVHVRVAPSRGRGAALGAGRWAAGATRAGGRADAGAKAGADAHEQRPLGGAGFEGSGG